MKLSAENVEDIFTKSLFADGTNDTSKAIIVEGIRGNFGFDPDRIKLHEENISSMLNGLSDDFRQSKGGGMSFMNACDDRNGVQWTGFHATMEKLFCLGMAIGKVESLMPRDMWDVLPGGMPYYVILDGKK